MDYTVAIVYQAKGAKLLEDVIKITKGHEELGKKIFANVQRYQQLEKESTRLAEMSQRLRSIANGFQDTGIQASIAGAAIVAGPIAAMKAYADSEEANKRLQMILMNSSGVVSKNYGEAIKKANEWGRTLPGESKDMVEMMIKLSEKGIQVTDIINGVGEATAKLSVVMGNLPYAQTAEYMGTIKNSLDIEAKDMGKVTDTIQRMHYASGASLNDISELLKYSGANLSALGVTGEKNFGAVATIFGTLKQKGLDGSQIGTELRMAFAKMAVLDDEIKAGRGGEVRRILDTSGVQLNFFDEKGKFGGIENMVAELSKLSNIKRDDDVIKVLTKLFGPEAGTAMLTLVRSGVNGYNKMNGVLRDQANLQQRTDIYMSSIKMQWDTLSGTVMQNVRSLGQYTSETIHLAEVFKQMNNAAGFIGNMIDNHKILAGIMGTLVLGGGAALLAIGGLALGIAGVTKIVDFGVGAYGNYIEMQKYIVLYGPAVKAQILGAASGLKSMLLTAQAMSWAEVKSGISSIATTSLSTIKQLAGASWTTIMAGLRGVSVATWQAVTASWAFAISPIGLTIIGIAAGAFLLWKYWDKVTYAFKFWVNVGKYVFDSMKGLSNGVLTVLAVVAPFIAVPILIWKNWYQIQLKLSIAWEFLKITWKQLMNIFLWTNPVSISIMAFKKLTDYLSKLDFYNEGKNIVISLVKGMVDYQLMPVRALGDMLMKMKRFLPHSPAKEGPFSDLHKTKIMETIAMSIKPSPVILAMQSAMQGISGIMFPRNQMSFAGAGSSGGGIHITITNQFNGIDSNQAGKFANDIEKQIVRVLNKIETDRNRRRY